jgi:hypothetical protein
MPEMSHQPQRCKELSSVQRIPRSEARAEQPEHSVDVSRRKRRVAEADQRPHHLCTDRQRGVVRVVVERLSSALATFACEVEQSLGVERILGVCECRRAESWRAHAVLIAAKSRCRLDSR